MARPILIDPADGPCEICAGWRAAKEIKGEDGRNIGLNCDGCGKQIPAYAGMGGSGFQSQTIHHWHLKPINGIAARQGVTRELCRECQLIDHAEAYPGQPLPELPLPVA